MKRFDIYRNEGGDAPEGGGFSQSLEIPPVETAPAAPAATAPAPEGGATPYSFYTGDKGARTLKPELATMMEGDDNKSMRNFMEKFANADNPMEAISKGMTNINYMAGNSKIDHLLDLPNDAPESLKQEMAEARRKITGAPEKWEDYGIERPESIDEGVFHPEGLEESFMQLAHKHGWSQESLKEAFELNRQLNEGIGAHTESVFAAKNGEASAALKEQYGHDLQGAVDMADRGMKQAGLDDDTINILVRAATMAGKGAELFNAFKKYGDEVSEDQRISSPGSVADGGMSNLAKAKDIQTNPDNPLHAAYRDPNSARNEEVIAMVSALNKEGHRLGEKS